MSENTYNLNYGEQLMAGRQLAAEKRKEAGGESENTAAERTDDGSYAAWRRRAVAMRRMMLRKKMAEKTQAADPATAPVRQASTQLLRSAWLALIPSWGLSLIWIDIHAFLRVIFPKFFCKLGEEWLPPQVTKRTGQAGGMAAKGAFIVEGMGLAALNLIFLFVILAFLVIIVYIVDMIGGFKWYIWKAVQLVT